MSMRICIHLLLSIAVFFLCGGCKGDVHYREYIPDRVIMVMDNFLNDLVVGNGAEAEKAFVPDLRNSKGEKMVADAIQALKTSPILSTTPYEVVLYDVNGEVFGMHHEVTYQIQRQNGWVLAHIGVDEVSGRFIGVTAMDLRYLPMSLQELHAFTFKGKPWRHYAVLAVCAVNILLVGISLILLCCTKTEKPWIRWAWLFLIFIGFIRASFNWTSGEVIFYPTGGAGEQMLYHLGWVVNVVHYSPYEPWYIQCMVPIGALVFLWRRKALIAQAEEKN